MSDRITVVWLALEWPRHSRHSGGVGRYLMRLAYHLKDRVDLVVIGLDGAIPLEGIRLVTLPAPRTRFHRFYVSPWQARSVLRSLPSNTYS